MKTLVLIKSLANDTGTWPVLRVLILNTKLQEDKVWHLFLSHRWMKFSCYRMEPTTLLSLPTELLLAIFDQVYLSIDEHKIRFYCPQRHYFQLAPVCRQFYNLLSPFIWDDIYLYSFAKLSLFNRTLSRRSQYARFVRGFHLYWDGNSSDYSYQQRMSTDGKRLDPLIPLQFSLQRLPNLQCLDIQTCQSDEHGKLRWSLNLDSLPKLERLHVEGLYFAPSDVDEMLMLKPLTHLEIDMNFCRATWTSRLSPLKTIAEILYLSIPLNMIVDYRKPAKEKVARRIIQGFLSNIQKLELNVPPEFFENNNLDAMLEGLKMKLKLLTLAAMVPVIGRRSKLDFSDWPCLETLSFDATIFWPFSDDSGKLIGLYNALPSSLRSLSVSMAS